MIQEFVDCFMENKDKLKEIFLEKRPECYKDVVKAVVTVLNNKNWHENPDPNRIHQIDDGDYQGALVFVIGEQRYQPSKYWYVKVEYGGCYECDTLIKQVDGYMTLALHIVQRLKVME